MKVPGARAEPPHGWSAGLLVLEKRGASLVVEQRDQGPERSRAGDMRGDSYNAAKHCRSRPLPQLNITLSEVGDHALAGTNQRQARLRRRGNRREHSAEVQRVLTRGSHRGRPSISSVGTLSRVEEGARTGGASLAPLRHHGVCAVRPGARPEIHFRSQRRGLAERMRTVRPSEKQRRPGVTRF